MKTIIDNAIILGTLFISIFISFQIIYCFVTNLNRKIKEQEVINKFNTIMIVCFEENYKSHICSVFPLLSTIIYQRRAKIFKQLYCWKRKFEN